MALTGRERELTEQKSGLLEIGSLEALPEPAVDRRDQRACLLLVALLLEEIAKSCRVAEIERARALAQGDV